jgi:hypothetical protein
MEDLNAACGTNVSIHTQPKDVLLIGMHEKYQWSTPLILP